MRYSINEIVNEMYNDWLIHWYKQPVYYTHIKDDLMRNFYIDWMVEREYSDNEIEQIILEAI